MRDSESETTLTDRPFAGLDEPDRPETVRSPMTPVRLVVAGIVLVLMWLLARASGGDTSEFGPKILPLFESIPSLLLDAIVGLAQVLVALSTVIGLVALVATGRYTRFAKVVGAAVLSMMMLGLIAATAADGVYTIGMAPVAQFGLGRGYQSPLFLAGLTAAVVVDSPWWSLR